LGKIDANDREIEYINGRALPNAFSSPSWSPEIFGEGV